MASLYVSSVKWAAITPWAASTAYTVGQYRRQLAAVTNANGRVFKCTTAGTSGGSEPSWTLTNNGTTNDGTVVWTQIGGQEAEQLAGDWRAALPTLEAARILSVSAIDFIFVSHDHAETVAGSFLVSGADQPRLCVNSGGSMPPVEADLTTGAQISTTGTNTLTLTSSAYFYGFTFKSGTGASTVNLDVTGSCILEKCRLSLGSTGASSRVRLGQGSTATPSIEFVNTQVGLSVAGQAINLGSCSFRWRDTSTPFVGTAPTTPFLGAIVSSIWPQAKFVNLDLSIFTGTLYSPSLAGSIIFESCKVNAAAIITSTSSTLGFENTLKFHNCDDGSGAGNFFSEAGFYSNVRNDVLYADGGATDGVNPISILYTPRSNNERQSNMGYFPRISKRVNTTGGSKTFTVEAIYSVGIALPQPTRATLYGEFSIMTSSGSPVGARLSTRTSSLDTSAPQASTVAWDGGLPARTNSTLRPIGYLFAVASNPGRVFIITASGTTSASEPAAFATAVDGDVITDGASTARALNRVKFQVTATPARQGSIFFRPFVHMQSTGSVFWLDPKIRIT